MHQHSNVVDEVFFALCKSVDTGISLGAWLRYKYDKRQLVSMSIDASWYNTAYDFSLDYAVISYLEKSQFLKTDIKTKEAAIQRFNDAESVCADTNRTIKLGLGEMPALDALIWRMQRKISDILGPVRLGHMMELCKWGPGSTADIRRSESGVDVKMTRTPSITARAYPYGKAMVENDYLWFEAVTGFEVQGAFSVLPSFFKFVEENRVVIVPKNAKTGRTIAAEPTLNSYMQQGVGRYIRKRLKRRGVELNNQQLNQSLAEHALRLELATIDLKAASDTIAREVVEMLLPREWYDLLNDLRSHGFTHPTSKVVTRYEKFSSMGNAFTFELESLIFTAAVLACYEEHADTVLRALPFSCAVYGDDIICPSVLAPRLIELLAGLGFSTNIDKTHVSGQFYESCGKHFYGGYDVTPAYQKRKLFGSFEIVRAGNRLFRLAYRLGGHYGLDSKIYGAWAAMHRYAGDTVKARIPFSERDDGWLTPADELPGDKYHRDKGWRCFILKSKRRFRPANSIGVYAHRLKLNQVAGRQSGGREVIPLTLPGLREELKQKALSLPGLGTVDGNGDRIELEANRYKLVRRWVKSDVEFEAVWN